MTLLELAKKKGIQPAGTTSSSSSNFNNSFPKEAPIGVHQSFMQKLGSALDKFGQAGSDVGVGIASAVTAPFVKVAGSGIREIQSIPEFLKDPLLKTAQDKSNEIAEQPIFGQKTLAGSTNLQNLGTAAEAASFLIPGGAGVKGLTVQGAKIGATQGGGQYLSNSEDPTALGFAASTAGGAALGAGFGYVAGRFTPEAMKLRADKAAKEVDDLVGTVIQGKADDVVTSRKVLSNLDANDVKSAKTYKEVGDLLAEKEANISNKLDSVLDTKPQTKSRAELTLESRVGNETIQHNYVDDALNQLEDLYVKTNDVAQLARIRQLKVKASTQGLTIKEVNNLAKQHGIELKAFNANGEAASGLSKQAAENTRKGLKVTARESFGDKTFNEADSELSNIIRTKELVESVAEKVTTLQQKIQERGFGAKVGYLIGKVINTLGLGSPKGIVEALIPRGQGFKTMNALDLEKALQNSLKKIQAATAPDLPESTIISKLEEIIKGGNKQLLLPPGTGPKQGKLPVISLAPRIMPTKIHPLETGGAGVRSRIIRPTGTSKSQEVTQIFPDEKRLGGAKKTLKGDNNPLIQEAKKYKSAEEFVKAKTSRPDYGYGHSPNEDGVRAFNLTEKVDGEQMIPSDMYEKWYGSRGTPEDLESISVLKKIKGNPEAEVTIYRASPKDEWNYGDWTTFSKKYAQTHAEGNNLKVFSKKVKAKDVRWAMDDVNEFGYFPESTKSQLTDIWNKTKGIKKK